ncbi:nucleoside hydrolase [Auriculariales sp. MPI-PUGE-AT-0066]|nr:nucleoside hydrolase [Auriculariales sp. MPI-PUGE-AT-0066]
MNATAHSPHRVILDTDPGVDDVLALLLLLASPEISIEAITVCFGNTTVDHAYDNVLKVYEVVRRHCASHPEDAHRFQHLSHAKKTMLAKGAKGPFEGKLELAEYFHGDDGLSNISTTHPEFNVKQPFTNEWLEQADPNTNASQLIVDILRREPRGTVTLLGVGPMTNIARAYQIDPLALGRAKKIVLMAGVAVAEFNVFADPFAAGLLLGAHSAAERPLPILVVPLDISTLHTVPFDALITSLDDPAAPPLERFVSVVLDRPRRVLKLLGYPDVMEMHDPLAAYVVLAHVAVTGPQLLDGWVVERRTILVERVGEHTRGMFVTDRRNAQEQPGTVRAEDGIAAERKAAKPINRAVSVDVLKASPSVEAFRAELLRRMVWWSPAAK